MSHNDVGLVKAEFNSWLKYLGFLSSVFLLFATFTSLFYRAFGWQLLPVFENTIEAFQAFVHWVFDKLFFDWVLWAAGWIMYVVLLGLSYLSDIEPFIPQLSIPPWLKDLALISMILLRAQKRAMSYSDPLSTLEMSELERSEWEYATRTTMWYWNAPIKATWFIVLLLYGVAKPIELPFRYVGLKRVGKGFSLFIGGAVMLGFAYLSHDLLVAIATRRIKSDHAVAHRRFLFWMVVSILCAVAASLIFFLLNGYVLDIMTKPK